MDNLSGVLKALKFDSAIFFDVKFGTSWKFQSPVPSSLPLQFQFSAKSILSYCFVVEGTCLARLEGSTSIRLREGDAIFLPHGDFFTLESSSLAESPPLFNIDDLIRNEATVSVLGGGAQLTNVVLGYIACDPVASGPILAELPGAVVVNLRQSGQVDWLESIFISAVAETKMPTHGLDSLRAKLAELLVVETVRRFISEMPDGDLRWVAGLRDRIVGRCVALMHAQPEVQWTLESLARAVGTSRSVLAQRFTYYLGQAPMQYLGKWRMAIASNLVRQSNLTMLQIALEVGYESDTSFNRAFKREFGVPPAAYRRYHISNTCTSSIDTNSLDAKSTKNEVPKAGTDTLTDALVAAALDPSEIGFSVPDILQELDTIGQSMMARVRETGSHCLKEIQTNQTLMAKVSERCPPNLEKIPRQSSVTKSRICVPHFT